MILRILQMRWMIAPADGGDGWSLAAGRVAGCGDVSLRAFAAVHLPVDLPATANVHHDNELSPAVVTAIWPMAEGGGGE